MDAPYLFLQRGSPREQWHRLSRRNRDDHALEFAPERGLGIEELPTAPACINLLDADEGLDVEGRREMKREIDHARDPDVSGRLLGR